MCQKNVRNSLILRTQDWRNGFSVSTVPSVGVTRVKWVPRPTTKPTDWIEIDDQNWFEFNDQYQVVFPPLKVSMHPLDLLRIQHLHLILSSLDDQIPLISLQLSIKLLKPSITFGDIKRKYKKNKFTFTAPLKLHTNSLV